MFSPKHNNSIVMSENGSDTAWTTPIKSHRVGWALQFKDFPHGYGLIDKPFGAFVVDSQIPALMVNTHHLPIIVEYRWTAGTRFRVRGVLQIIFKNCRYPVLIQRDLFGATRRMLDDRYMITPKRQCIRRR